jgi:hypothetical protein
MGAVSGSVMRERERQRERGNLMQVHLFCGLGNGESARQVDLVAVDQQWQALAQSGAAYTM